MIKKITTIAVVSMLSIVPTSYAKGGDKPLKDKYREVYHQVNNKYGKDGSGRNISRRPVKWHGEWREPKPKEYAQAIRILRENNKKYPYMSKNFGAPYFFPGRIPSARLEPVGLAQCIVHHESGYDPMASNKGKYKGIAQWSSEAWSRHGGHKYGPTPFHANYQQQLKILSNGLNIYGCIDWCPFDPC